MVRRLRGQAQPINSCPKCGAMYTGNSHTCHGRRTAERCPVCHHLITCCVC
jgi:hypothetical protein